jgi:hypothetical protein
MLKINSQVEFKNDPKIYYVKNISQDGINVFVTLNGLQTYRKNLKNLIKIDSKMITENSNTMGDDNTRLRNQRTLRVFIHNFGGKENFEKIQDILKTNNIDFEKKVASFSDKELANIVGLLINSNLSKTPAVAASQKYKNTVEVLKNEILNDFPQLKYREFKSLAEHTITKGQLKQLIREELKKIITK